MRHSFSAVLTSVLAAGLLIGGPVANAAPAAQPTATPATAAAGPAGTFTPRSPVRVLDTRTGTGVAVPARGTITLDLAPYVPATATAVVLNVTGVTPTASTFVTVFPSGIPRPVSSSLNLSAGDIRANQVTVVLGADRRLSLYNNAGSTHLVADLAGHYAATDAEAKFTPLPPKRLLDTRTDHTTLGPGGTRVLDLTGSVPASATAVTFNLTATKPTLSTFLIAWPAGTTRPNVSNLNLPAGDTRPNLVTVALGAGRKVALYNNSGSTDVIVDLSGFYTREFGTHFQPLSPQRVLDTRNGTGTGGSTNPVGPQGYAGIDLAGAVPANSAGVVLNLTGVDATAATVVTAWAPVGDVPIASTLNVPPARPVANAAVVAFAFDRQVALHNKFGNVHLVADLAGVFTALDPTPCTNECVYGWGNNYGQQLGTGQRVRSAPVTTPVVNLDGVRAVAGSPGNGYALRADGTVWAWGENYFGELGNGWTADTPYGTSAVPVPVAGLTGVTAIAARGEAAYALRTDGTVWAWGDNHRGQLGNGTRTRSAVPVRVSGLTGVVSIGAGDNNGYAVRADGTLWSWGDNGGGHLGTGSTADMATTPVQVTALTGVTAVAGGGHSNGTYALRADGTVWAWGYNFNGALGHGTPCEPGADCLSRVPVRVSGLTGVTAIASGVYHGQALRDDGTVWTWGANDHGTLGNGAVCDVDHQDACRSHVPVRVANLTDVTAVSAFYGGGYALRADGTVWSWGGNDDDTLGNGSVTGHTTVPVQVEGLTGARALGSGSSGGYAVVPNP